jgi:hypothetical protein
MNPDRAGSAADVRVIVRWQRIAFTGGGVLAALALTAAALGARGPLLALPALTGLMGMLIGGLLWVSATMMSFDRSDDDEQPGDGQGGSSVPEGPSSPPGVDWDRFDDERRDWARDREPTPV